MLSSGVAAYLRGARPEDPCPDAEELAVYAEGSESADERGHIDRHVAGCARCQAHMAALARSAPPLPPPRSILPWRWFVPLATASVLVAALWLNQARGPETPKTLSTQPAPAAADAVADSSTPVAGTPEAGVATPQAGAVEAPPQERKRAIPAAPAAESDRSRAEKQSAPPPAAADRRAAAPAPMAQPLPESSPTALAFVPDWRLTNGIVERSVDAGRSWIDPFRPDGTTLRAIAGVSRTVCWAVGDAGAVFRTVDGTTWTRVTFPEPLPLTGIQAFDADRAIVSTATGRRFETSDGGREWRER